MNTHKSYMLTILLGSILILGAGIQPSVAIPSHDKGNGQVTVATDQLVVKITGGGNIPAYFFWAVDDNETMYRVQFDQVFEAHDNNSDGVYDVGSDQKVAASTLALAPLKWDFSEIVEDATDGGSLHFNLTSSSIGADDSYIQFNNHLRTDEGNQLKFDVIIDGYSFKDPDAMLVLGFKLILARNNETAEQDDDTVTFGNGFFKTKETANANGDDIGVKLSLASAEEPKMYLAYEHFDGKLVHDPSLGVDLSAVNQDTSDGDQTSDHNSIKRHEVIPSELSKADLVAVTLVASIIAVLVPVVVFRFKKH